ncbi:MAG: rhodanese-like domain-containing protein [Chitinophagaceae bacterium]|nr:rhodanese-like domain-containing protein [Chitinophagaceae bacterium]
MKKITVLLLCSVLGGLTLMAQPGRIIAIKKTNPLPPSKVDFDAYDSLAGEVKQYRKDRLISLAQFRDFAKEPNTVILDTRSAEMYKRKHVKGAIHLNFSDFTQENLRRLIPSADTRILIYCNNNFDNDPVVFATKSFTPRAKDKSKPITLALNIPTFINLYGYGYKNVYELADLVSVFNPFILFEGTDVALPAAKKKTTVQAANTKTRQ